LKDKDFLIITCYTQQRDHIKNGISESLQSKVCTVDSAQGQEADYIIFSVTRTEKVGFLSNQRRTNVALTRCKKKLIVLVNFMFLQGIGSKTLVGKLYSKNMGSMPVVSYQDVLDGKVFV
jgi:superfamily I DNA and/or RNA helicase